MKCPECNGRGETIYYVETDHDENSITVEQRKGVCRTCNGSGKKPMTNADRIRAMDDELLAIQLTQVFKEGVEAVTDVEVPDELWNMTRSDILKKLQQPAEGE